MSYSTIHDSTHYNISEYNIIIFFTKYILYVYGCKTVNEEWKNFTMFLYLTAVYRVLRYIHVFD